MIDEETLSDQQKDKDEENYKDTWKSIKIGQKYQQKFRFCCLKVWDKGSGLEDAIAEERKGFNKGDDKNMKDMWEIICWYLHD